MTWDFMHPGRLWWLFAVVGIVVLYVFAEVRRRRNLIRFSSVAMLDSVAPRRPVVGRHLVAALTMAGLAVGTLAVAQPSDKVRVPRQRATIMLALDTSLSMKATDVTPSRIAAAKVSAKSFVDRLPKALNVGLVSFDTGARVNVDPTTDRSTVKNAIDKLKLHEGTAIGDAVRTSLEAITEVPKGDDGKAVPALIVLLSDGSTTVGTPTEAAIEPAKKAGVPVYTIAYGTQDGVIDVTLPDTGETARVPVPVNVEALASLAEGTGGQSFRAESASDLSTVYQELGSSVGYDMELQEVTWRYVVVAMILLGLGTALSLAFFQRLT